MVELLGLVVQQVHPEDGERLPAVVVHERRPGHDRDGGYDARRRTHYLHEAVVDAVLPLRQHGEVGLAGQRLDGVLHRGHEGAVHQQDAGGQRHAERNRDPGGHQLPGSAMHLRPRNPQTKRAP